MTSRSDPTACPRPPSRHAARRPSDSAHEAFEALAVDKTVRRFFGPVPNSELISYSASADIGLANIVGQSVSYETSLPNKLFEYAMAGIPVIGSDSPEIGRIIKETGIGLTCDPEDATAIAKAIDTIRTDPTPFREATGPASDRYNWDVESQVLLDLYASIETT